ncbi:MAG: hypothetical protein JNM42_18885 [Propionivibrio sp.]|uniref:hypothetical protein n=1 Tax=Propionivibrio sp. TaxID=2212460 RepID=UPI001A38E81F|nr:hypothetical protein [Propionivibrio sp.]MBL8416494.1 hypothetical protein [Propionivibrio sp.]
MGQSPGAVSSVPLAKVAPAYLVFDRKHLNPINSSGFSRFYFAEELSSEGGNKARRTEILGWRPKPEEIFALDTAPDL